MGHQPWLVEGGLSICEHQVPILHMPVYCLAGRPCSAGTLSPSPLVACLPCLVALHQQLLGDCCTFLQHTWVVVSGPIAAA